MMIWRTRRDSKPLHAKREKVSKLKKIMPDMRAMLSKVMLEAALSVEFRLSQAQAVQLKQQSQGVTRKTVHTEDSQFELDTPRGRHI